VARTGSNQPQQKQRANVYTMMFIVAILALGIGCALLYLQQNRYFYDQKTGQRLQEFPEDKDLWLVASSSAGMQNTLYAVGGIAFIVFFVGFGMSYRTWRVHTLIALFAIFCLTVALTAFTIPQLHIHRYWGKQANELTVEIQQVKQRNKELEKGVEKEEKFVKFGIKQLKERLVDITRDRGRMWTGAQPSAVDPATGEVTVAVTVPKEHQIKPKMLLFAFEDRPAGTSGAYLGAFRVTSVLGGEAPMEEPMAEAKPAEGDMAKPAEGDMAKPAEGDMAKPAAEGMAEGEKPAEPMQPAPAAAEGAGGESVVTLLPAWRISPGELNRLKNSAGPWVLHDKMPPDNHESLVKVHVDPLTEAPLMDAEGKPIDRVEQIKRLVPKSVAGEYVNDYQPAGKDDPPQRVAVLVQFLEKYTLPAAAAAAAPVAAAPAAEAGLGGGAGAPANVPPPAPPAEPIEFQNGTRAWILEPLAKELVEMKKAKIVQPVQRRYERELRDYAKLFETYYIERTNMANEIENLERQNTTVVGVHTKNVALIESVEAEKGRLAHDLTRFQFESAALAKHLAALKQQYQEVAGQIRTLFLANLQLAAKLEAQQREAAASIDRRAPAPPQAIGIPK